MWSYANVWQHWWLKASHSPASALSCCFPACKSSLLLSPVKFHNGLARALSVSPNIMKTWKPSFAAKGNSLLNPGRCWMKSTSLWTVAHLLGVGRAFLLERLIVQRSGNSLTGVVSKKELIRLSVTTYRKHDKYVRRMICGTGEYYRRIELCLPEQLQSGHRPEKVTAAASWWTLVARHVDGAAGGAEQAAGWAVAVGDSRACAPRCPRGTGLKSALSSLPAVNDWLLPLMLELRMLGW